MTLLYDTGVGGGPQRVDNEYAEGPLCLGTGPLG